jgi:hypothetical protein
MIANAARVIALWPVGCRQLASEPKAPRDWIRRIVRPRVARVSRAERG